MKRTLILALMPLMLAGCTLTRIVTTSPATPTTYTYVAPAQTYSTTVTVPRTKVATTTTRVVAASEDISLYLDLQAIGAAFAQSSTVQEFENLINNSSYMLSNLDLNGDGYVDYLRVMETLQGCNHVFVIQAVLSANVFQDVATVIAEVPNTQTCYVQIVGAPYIYGPKYIVEPVFIARPLICTHLLRVSYAPWRSPWYWDHFPAHYRCPRPIIISHYHAYVDTFMRNHHYCNHVTYPASYHYPAYESVARPVQRNDYEQQHPERTFLTRTASTPSYTTQSGATKSIVNARDVRENFDAKASVTTSSRSTANSTRGTSTTRTTTASASTTTASGTPSASSTSTSSRSTSTSTRTASTSTSPASTSSTGTPTASSSGTTSRSTATSGRSTTGSASTTSTASSSRSTASTTPARTSTGTASTSSSRSTSASRSSSTTVKSSVRTSGSSNTSIRTTSSVGRTSTTSRTTSAASSSSSRSTSSGSATRSASSSAGTSSRSTSTSTRSR